VDFIETQVDLQLIQYKSPKTFSSRLSFGTKALVSLPLFQWWRQDHMEWTILLGNTLSAMLSEWDGFMCLTNKNLVSVAF